MRFTPSFLEEIKERIPIADVIGRRVTFDRKKSNPAKGDFWGCCPFHGEKTPSFHCENPKGRYHCFGCGVSGDHFKFLTEMDGLAFPEAVERLADEAGVAMPAVDPQAIEQAKTKASLYDVMTLAVQFFKEQLHSPQGAKARAYLRDRGLSAAIQERFGLGYAPSSRSALKEYLGAQGVEKDKIEACGLVVHGPDIAVSYDRFRDRIMFPILDARERPIAFGGRALSADVPAKYLNSPETELFSKSRVLYNYARARKAVERGGSLIVCEGYMDVIALSVAGFDHGVAPLGTALTEAQMELAWRVGGEPNLCFDGDEAGLRAAFRSIDTALTGLKPGRSLRFALLPAGEDPDDLIKRAGAEAFQEVLDNARPLADMLWTRETQGHVYDTPEKRAELERNLFTIVSQISDDNVKRHYQQDLRDRLASFFGTVERSKSGKGGKGGGFQDNKKQPYAKRGGQRFAVSEGLMNSPLIRKKSVVPPLRETALVVSVINHPAIGVVHFDQFASLQVNHYNLQQMHNALLDIFADYGEKGEQPSRDLVHNRLCEQGLEAEMNALKQVVAYNRIWQAEPDADVSDALDGWLQAFGLHVRYHVLEMELEAAKKAFEESEDEESFQRLVAVKNEIDQEEGVEALIEGFGLSSGRPSRGF